MKALLRFLAAAAALALPVVAQQASITLQASGLSYCYKQDTTWTLAEANDHAGGASAGDTVNWTVTAVKNAPGPRTVCANGFLSIQNTGSAPATVGNIVVNLQRNLGKPAKWTAVGADVADATRGNAAQGIAAAGAMQNQTNYAAVATLAGAGALFHENAVSGPLEFTDAGNNTVWALTPATSIQPGQTVSLYFDATFNVDALALAPGEQLRTEVLVSFGNAGARGGSGATAANLDINGNGVIDAAEAYVRTVPARLTAALPALRICNDSVTISDVFGATSGASYVLTGDPIAGGVTTSGSASYVLSATVGGGGTVSNTVSLDGADTAVTLVLGPPDPLTGIAPSVQRLCCSAAHEVANSSVTVTAPNTPPAPVLGSYCSYTKGGWAGPGAPGQLLTANWNAVFLPAGLTIGASPLTATWTSLSALQSWLTSPVGGGSATLAMGTLNAQFDSATRNATATGGGSLAEQTATLALNLALGPFMHAPGIGGLTLSGTGTTLDGYTVAQILGVADAALAGGGLPAGFTYDSLNALITNLNESWDNCTAGAFALNLR